MIYEKSIRIISCDNKSKFEILLAKNNYIAAHQRKL